MAKILNFIKIKSIQYWKITKQEFYAESPLVFVRNIFLMIIGSAMVSFGACLFYFPLSIVSGGVSGLVIIFEKFMPFLDKEVWNLIITWVLFVFGLILLGFRFSIKTLIATIVYPLFTFAFQELVKIEIFDITKYLISGEHVYGLSEFQITTANLGIYIIGGVFGGAITGIGCSLTFVGGGSTGGVDCIMLAMQKYLKIKASISCLMIDSSIIIGGFFVHYDLAKVLVGIIASILCSFLIDKVFLGGNKEYVAFIVSTQYAAISKEINYKLERGTTLIKSVGGFTGRKGYTIQCAFERKDYKDLLAIVNRHDKKAFMTVVRADEITGYGFKTRTIKKKYIKVKTNTKGIVPLEEITPLTKEELMMEDLRYKNMKNQESIHNGRI